MIRLLFLKKSEMFNTQDDSSNVRNGISTLEDYLMPNLFYPCTM